MSNQTTGDLLAVQEAAYRARKPEADAFVRGMVADQILRNQTTEVLRFTSFDGTTKVWHPFRDEKGQVQFSDALAEKAGGKAVDPIEYYGKAYGGSPYAAQAVAYLATLPQKEEKHPLYKKPTFGFAP